MPAASQQLFDELCVEIVVFRHQYPQWLFRNRWLIPRECIGLLRLSFRGPVLRLGQALEASRESKCAAFTGTAVDRDCAPHELDKPRGDRQS